MPVIAIAAFAGAAAAILAPGVAALGTVLGYAALSAGLAGASLLLAPKPRLVGTERADQAGTVVRATVAAARWILGRARVGGVLIFVHERPRLINDGADLHLAQALSESECTQILEIWIGGEAVPFTRTARTGTGESGFVLTPTGGYANTFTVYEYFKADGAGGDSLVAASDGRWTAAHKLNSISWVHIHLRQQNYKDDTNRRFWTRIPEMEFLVQGINFTYPGRVGKAWSRSAAAIRYWWLTVRRGVPPEAIDSGSVQAADLLCRTSITYTLSSQYAGYDNTAPRYSIDGVIYSDDDPERIEQEFDFCWQGSVIESNGVHFFRPGSDRTVVRALDTTDIMELTSIQPGPGSTGPPQQRYYDSESIVRPKPRVEAPGSSYGDRRSRNHPRRRHPWLFLLRIPTR